MKKSYVAIALYVSFLLVVGLVYAVNTLSFHQSLTVAAVSGIEVYRSDGTTAIAEASDQTSIWTWDPANFCFSATIKVKNVGNNPIGVSIIATNLGGAWAFTTSGTLTGIAPTELRSVVLYVTNALAIGGSVTGDFTLTVSKV